VSFEASQIGQQFGQQYSCRAIDLIVVFVDIERLRCLSWAPSLRMVLFFLAFPNFFDVLAIADGERYCSSLTLGSAQIAACHLHAFTWA
jgi:hypothetical protein